MIKSRKNAQSYGSGLEILLLRMSRFSAKLFIKNFFCPQKSAGEVCDATISCILYPNFTHFFIEFDFTLSFWNKIVEKSEFSCINNSKKSEFSSKNKLNSYWPLPPRGIIFACFAYVNDQFWLPPVTSDIFIVFAIRYAFPTKMFFGIWFSEALFCWAFGTETGALLQLANIQVMVMRFWIKAPF